MEKKRLFNNLHYWKIICAKLTLLLNYLLNKLIFTKLKFLQRQKSCHNFQIVKIRSSTIINLGRCWRIRESIHNGAIHFSVVMSHSLVNVSIEFCAASRQLCRSISSKFTNTSRNPRIYEIFVKVAFHSAKSIKYITIICIYMQK